MARRLASVLAGAALVLAAVAPSAEAGSTSKCRTSSTSSGARIVTRSSEAVVFTKRGNTYGCLYTGSIRRLPSEGGDEDNFTLTGRYAGYTSRGSAIGDEFDRVYVYDLRLGRAQSISPSNFVTKLVLKRNGSVAWTQGSVVREPVGAPQSYEVRMHQAADPDDILLDRGIGIDPGSLALTSTRTAISWTRDGQARTAPID